MGRIVAESKRVVAESTAGAIGFYSTGQIFHEEYYTLGVLGKAGVGTPHMDGNTRLCTATAAAALKETFGSDGQPASYDDFDVTDAFLLVGHNVAEQQTVLWSRILDRRRGPDPPKLIVIDPRTTATAKEADVHLALRPGTNVAVLNGLLHLVIKEGRLDRDFLDAHTVGFDDLARAVAAWEPRRVKEVSGIPVERLRAAAKILGQTPSLVSTVLQGVYQSNQATAAAVQVNNLNLIRGLIGKPGSGILQMNGQPTAQNNREAGADGDLPGFRNWHNPEHIAELARLWNVDVDKIPHWAPPTHAMQIFRYCESGSIRFLWIIATNPAVSLPELGRIRKILAKPDLFVVVQDAFPTETTALADVVLPAALCGEKTGVFTNADRSVHLSMKAVEPPGEARSDLEIFLDYARRMDFRDRDGAPLIKWPDAEGAFDAWKACSKGRPCDYSGMTYERLARGPIRWPCNEAHPDGSPRLYTDAVFPSSFDECETFGHDLDTGGNVEPERYRANDPAGRAILKPADYRPPHERPDEEYPLWLTTGRVVYHFHTRTKTARSKALNDAAPDVFVEVSEADAGDLGLAEGDVVEVASRRGRIEAPVRIGAIEPGVVFVPFHYGDWDRPGADRAANELTLPAWDPVSKQPHFKYAAVKLTKLGPLGRAGEAVAGAVGGVASAVKKAVDSVAAAVEAPPRRLSRHDPARRDRPGAVLRGRRRASRPGARHRQGMPAPGVVVPRAGRVAPVGDRAPRRVERARARGPPQGPLPRPAARRPRPAPRPPRPLAPGQRGEALLGDPPAGGPFPPRRGADGELRGRARLGRPPGRLAPDPDRPGGPAGPRRPLVAGGSGPVAHCVHRARRRGFPDEGLSRG